MVGYSINAPEQKLSWDEMKIMFAEWDFGSHGVTHRSVNDIPPDKIRYELSESRDVMQKMLGNEIGLFCYPYGKYNDVALRLVKEVGYKAAVSNAPGLLGKNASQNIYTLPRIEWKGLTPFSIKTLWDLKWFYLKILLGV
jgi:peptidoglycan/xylan/chitin deacetylase (PgdA/CDA1 family)